MVIYDSADKQHSLLVAQWWALAQETGDLALMAVKRAQSLGGFFKMLERPNVLVFEADEQGMWIAGWFEPSFDFAFFSLWVRKDMRRGVALEALDRIYALGFQAWPVLMGVTKQERLLASHERLGYHIVGKIPGIFDGEDAWLVMLSKENYGGRRGQRGNTDLGKPGAGSVYGGVEGAVAAGTGRDV